MKALGVDVGLHQLDVVLLDEHRSVVLAERKVPPAILKSLTDTLQPNLVAIDSPPYWAADGGRQTENAMRRLNIQLHATPVEGQLSRKGFHGWMKTGIAAFESIADSFPLFDGGEYTNHAIEVYPHASAVALAGHLKPRERSKVSWRREVLHISGVSDSRLSNIDLVDAALGALTGIVSLEGNSCWFGRPEEGVIVLPCRSTEVPSRYPPPDEKPTLSAGLGRCVCGNRYPAGSKYCNQCGRPVPVA